MKDRVFAHSSLYRSASYHVQFFLSSTSSEGTRPIAWEFGQQQNRGLQRFIRPEQPYALDLHEHSGVVVGLTEAGLSMSLHRFAANATRQGWNVVMIDALSTQEDAAQFVAAIQGANAPSYSTRDAWKKGEKGYRRNRNVSESDANCGQSRWETSLQRDISWFLEESVVTSQDLWQMLLSQSTVQMHGRRSQFSSSQEAWYASETDAETRSTYLGVHALRHPEASKIRARALLDDLTRSLLRPGARTPVLLLIKHPELLFEAQEIAPLFSLLEHAGGSLFVAARSVASFGREAHRVMKNARTILAHRSNTSVHLEPFVSLPWWRRHPLFDGTLRRLSRDECFVIHEGNCTLVRVTPVNNEKQDDPTVQVPDHPLSDDGTPLCPDSTNVGTEELDALLSSLFGPGDDSQATEQAADPTDVFLGFTNGGDSRRPVYFNPWSKEKSYPNPHVVFQGERGSAASHSAVFLRQRREMDFGHSHMGKSFLSKHVLGELLTRDQVHLAQALSLLGRESF